MSQLDLIIPGLLGPFSDEFPAYLQQPLAEPVFNNLRRALSRAQSTQIEVADFHSTLQLLMSPESSMSVCEFTAKHSAIEFSNGYLYRADPVHYKAESDHAILLGPELLALQHDETQQLVEAFNQHFAEDNIELLADDLGHWYLRVSELRQLQCQPLDYALGRDIKHFMPSGDDALWWRRIVNEAQMLFFPHAVNQQREERGQLTINGLWLWDQALPEVATTEEPVTYNNVFSDHVLANCMATHAGYKTDTLQSFSSQTEFSGNTLVVIDDLYAAVCYGDQQAWLEALEVFCEEFFNPLFECLTASQIKQLNIYSADGRKFSLNSRFRYQFWVSNKPLTDFMLKDDQQ